MRSDVVDWVHKVIAVTKGALRDRFRQPRRQLSKSLDDLDWEIRQALADSVDCSRAGDGRLDVVALCSTEELRILVDLYLRGWTWPQIESELGRTAADTRSRI